MKISDQFVLRRPLVSFEFFPPKNQEGEEKLFQALEALRACSPSYVSVTYGAGGSTRDRTVALVGRIKKELDLEPLAHLTCVGATRDEIARVLDRFAESGVENVLALRGDPPKGEAAFTPVKGGFHYAAELVAFIRDNKYPFCVGGAAYPEGHPETTDLEADLKNLKAKVDAGTDFLVTQLFFDNQDFFPFVRRARAAGIHVPIVPGLMPVTSFSQVRRFTKMCGARIPQELYRRLRLVDGDPSAVVATGVYWTTRQAKYLLEGGAPGIHFYTLNKSSATKAVHAALAL
ncbi:MAG: methylenetetrahydrofolate reductase [NAD(P)H] [Myxococcota bacterium]